ncbi:MAG: hypothetical protein L3J23_04790 [Flavobacteriaceae bacterium]|nr:hypothetical protein [Flavobacteriaceae bacterium]
MSFKSIFHLDDKEYNVLQCNYDFHQNSDVNGRPSGKPFLTSVSILLEVKDITMFLLWATHPTMQKHFILEYLPRIVGTKGRKIYGFDVNCVKYEEVFNANSNTPHTVRLELTCGGFEEGNAKYSTTWRKTFSNKVPVTAINYNEEKEEEQEEIIEEKKDKKCVIKFEADNNDIKNGIFGFDTIPDKYKRICTSDITKLENEYPSLTVEGEKYFPAWVSMRKDQTIILDIDSTIKQKEEYESIAFEEYPDFTIVPIDRKGNKVDLKEAKKVKITCKNTNQNTAQIKVIADDKEAGAINFFYPKPKTIDLKWYFVEITGDEKDKKDLKNKINKTKLETLLKKGLNPALIDVNIVNDNAEIIDISEYKEDLKEKGTLKKHLDDKIGKYIERERILRIFSRIDIKHTKNTSIINLYSINRKCLHTKDINTDGTYKMFGGLSLTSTGLAYMTLEEGDKIQAENIIHEIMHALGLEHTFSIKAAHTFKPTKTKNYMDYENVKRLTWKWQWERLQKYTHLK